MCQGVIFVYNSGNNSYHWGTGSHSSLIHNVFKNSRPEIYDKLVRVECELVDGPGEFSIEGGHADDDQLAIFKDKILDKVGTPQKLAQYLKTTVTSKSGYAFDDAFTNIFNDKGRGVYAALTGDDETYRDNLTSKQTDLFDELYSLAEDNGYDYRETYTNIRAAIVLKVLGHAKTILTGSALNSALDKLKQVGRKEHLAKLAKAIADKLKNVDLYGEDYEFVEEIENALVVDVEFESSEHGGMNVASWVENEEDPFDDLPRNKVGEANKLYDDYLEKNYRSKLPKRDPSKMLEPMDAFLKIVQDKANLKPIWAKAYDAHIADAKASDKPSATKAKKKATPKAKPKQTTKSKAK